MTHIKALEEELALATYKRLQVITEALCLATYIQLF